MGKIIKKILVLLPVIVLGLLYLYDHYSGFRHLGEKRILFLAGSLFLLYGWMVAETAYRRQNDLGAIALQSSFYVYVFMVLTLTGFFILFREAPAGDWWDKMMMRVDKKDRVNLKPFQIFRYYALSNKQIIGNLVMLMPLGLYLPLLYRISNGFVFLLISIAVSVLIETVQLVTRYRSADVDDVMLNAGGAFIGYLIFRTIQAFLRTNRHQERRAPLAAQ